MSIGRIGVPDTGGSVEHENDRIVYGEVIDTALEVLRDSDSIDALVHHLELSVGLITMEPEGLPRRFPQTAIRGLRDLVRIAVQIGEELGVYDPTCPMCGGTGMVLGSTLPTGDDPERPCEYCDGTGEVR